MGNVYKEGKIEVLSRSFLVGNVKNSLRFNF